MSDEVFLSALAVVFGSFVVIAVSINVRLYLVNRGQRNLSSASDVQMRLERIEAAVETTALEVERIAEANRYMSKLLSERAGSVTPADTVP